MTQLARNDVGIVAIGRNEGRRLIECLTWARSVTGNVIYVDSGSTDNSVQAAEKIGAHVVELDLAKPFTAARARNEGFTKLLGLWPNVHFVQFIDGDCTLAQHWIERALAFVERRPDVAVVCGRRRERDPTGSIYNRLLDDEWNTPIGEAVACGGDALMRMEALQTAGGFRASLIAGEEPELCVRLRENGWKIWRLNEEMTQHDAAMHSFSQWWLRSVRSGYAFAEVSRLHRGSPHAIWIRETARAIFWGAALPIFIGTVALVHPYALWLASAYALQIIKIGVRRGPTTESWWFAVLSVAGKFAELSGILRFYWRNWRQRPAKLIEYKF